MAKISDLTTDAALELGNSATITSGAPSRVANWLKRSYQQVGASYRFSEADRSKTIQLTPDISTYTYPPDARAIVGITVYRPDGTAIPQDVKDLAYVRRYNNNPQTSNGPPSIVAYFGRQMFFAPPPDDATQYSVVIDYWQKPQITDNVVDTIIDVPDDWLEVVMYGAILRGHSALLERDKAQQIQQLLFGLTVPTSGKIVPGLCATMYSRYQAQAPYMDWGLAPSAARRGYTSTG